MKKLSIALLALLIGTQVYSNEIIGKRRIVKKVKTLLKNGELDKSRTCLDEFMQRDKKLKRVMGFGFPGIGGGLPVLGAATGAAIGSATSGGAAFLGLWAGTLMGGVVAPVGLLAYESIALSIFAKNRFLIKVISNARDGGGKSLRKFRKKFYLHYPEAIYLEEDSLAEIIVKADETGVLCDGSLNKSKKRPAWNREIYKYISQSL